MRLDPGFNETGSKAEGAWLTGAEAAATGPDSFGFVGLGDDVRITEATLSTDGDGCESDSKAVGFVDAVDSCGASGSDGVVVGPDSSEFRVSDDEFRVIEAEFSAEFDGFGPDIEVADCADAAESVCASGLDITFGGAAVGSAPLVSLADDGQASPRPGVTREF